MVESDLLEVTGQGLTWAQETKEEVTHPGPELLLVKSACGDYVCVTWHLIINGKSF